MDLSPYAGAAASVLTFGLGWLLASFIKRRDNRASETREHVAAIATLVTRWYNQLLELDATMIRKPEEAELAAYTYSNNRYVLPELKLHLEQLRSMQIASDLIAETDHFLSIVTSPVEVPPRARNRESGRSRVNTCLEVLMDLAGPTIGGRPLREQLRRLDAHVQLITHSAADALVAHRR